MNYYVFRIDYGECHDALRKEILEGRLRQGWGADGMTVAWGVEEYTKAWRTVWQESTADDGYIRRKYNNINIMREMTEGDIIVIPKLNVNDESDWRSFTIAVVDKGGYSFDVMDGIGDFGHIIKVRDFFSCAYLHNESSRDIIKKFRSYQRAITRVHDETVIAAIDKLMAAGDKGKMCENKMSTLEAVVSRTIEQRNNYIQAIGTALEGWSSVQLEKATEELFRKNGYDLIARNRFNRIGGDVDLTFSSYARDTLMYDIMAMSETEKTEIRVQLKNKKGNDTNDMEGILQLEATQGYEKVINILINLTEEYSDEAKRAAQEKGIIIINRAQFASLLIRHGLDISMFA